MPSGTGSAGGTGSGGHGGTSGGGRSGGEGGRASGGRGGRRGETGAVPRGRRTLLELIEQTHFVEGHAPKLGSLGTGATQNAISAQQEQTHFVEGHAAKLGSLTQANPRDISAQQAEWDRQFNLRKKIKPISDPGDVITGRKKAARRKQRGRVGTTTLSNAETLG